MLGVDVTGRSWPWAVGVLGIMASSNSSSAAPCWARPSRRYRRTATPPNSWACSRPAPSCSPTVCPARWRPWRGILVSPITTVGPTMASALILKASFRGRGGRPGFRLRRGARRHVPGRAGKPVELLPGSGWRESARPHPADPRLAVRPTGVFGKAIIRRCEINESCSSARRRTDRFRLPRHHSPAGGEPLRPGSLTLLAIYGILLIGLDVTVGYLGQGELGQRRLPGPGRLCRGPRRHQVRPRHGSGPAGSMAVGLLLGGLLALPALRLEGPQFALATLSFAALSTTGPQPNWKASPAGPRPEPHPPDRFRTRADSPLFLLAFAWRCWRSCGCSCATSWPHSGGRAFEALRDSPIATDAMAWALIGTRSRLSRWDRASAAWRRALCLQLPVPPAPELHL